MKIIIGLGNPGKKYQTTRHNAGIMALMDFFMNSKISGSSKWENEPKFSSLLCDTSISDKRVILVYPQTFMNGSGQAVKSVCDFFKIDIAKDLLVVHDDVDLKLGEVKFTPSSSAAGHNGVKSLIEYFGNQNFHRVRIGVESRPSREHLPTDAFVLENFTSTEIEILKTSVYFKTKSLIEKFIAT